VRISFNSRSISVGTEDRNWYWTSTALNSVSHWPYPRLSVLLDLRSANWMKEVDEESRLKSIKAGTNRYYALLSSEVLQHWYEYEISLLLTSNHIGVSRRCLSSLQLYRILINSAEFGREGNSVLIPIGALTDTVAQHRSPYKSLIRYYRETHQGETTPGH
jgi:hypothetical protein